jgi:N-acetylmuramic acid 6-phosphate etherase
MIDRRSVLRTEADDRRHAGLDLYPTPELVQAFVDDQLAAVRAVQQAVPQIARAVELARPRLEAGGRLVYVGAGTSGRLGLLDSVELFPTFSWPHERATALLAGGPEALMQAVEGAEDDHERGAADLIEAQVGASDVVLLIAASGGTPYVLGALEQARARGALTIGIANNPGAPVAQQAEVGIVLDTGSEVISGSTRLKAGTAQKIALNTFSSAVMVRLHKVYGNLMVDLQPTNAKLRQRALRLVVQAAGVDEADAHEALERCGYEVKTAIVALRCGLAAEAARERLQAVGGSVRAAIGA